jgi:predicted nucleotidyltransferase
MATATLNDPILRRYRAAVTDIYGDRVARVVLYGSRARGDAQPDSDYDVAVFLHDMPDRFAEMDRLADLSTAILDETGEFFHVMPYCADAYDDERMPLMEQIRSEGVDL